MGGRGNKMRRRYRALVLSFSLLPSLLFASLSVDECVELAKQNNSAIEIASYKTDRAIAVKNEMLSGFLPQVDLEAVIDNNNRSLSGDLTQFQDFHSTKAVGLSVNLGLWDFGQTLKRFKASKSRIYAAEYQEQQVQLEVEEKVRVAYARVLEKEKTAGVLQTSLGLIQQQLAKSKSLFDQGVARSTDVLSLQVQLSEKEKRLIQAKNELETERMRLNHLIGLSISESPQLEELQEKSGNFSYESALDYATDNRPDLKAYKRLLRALELERQAAIFSFAPKIFAFANGNYSSEQSSASAGIGMKMNLYSGGKRSAQVQRIDAEIRELRTIISDLKTTVSLEIRTTFLHFDEIEKGIELNKEAINLAEENLKNTQDLYHQGLQSINDVLIALEQLSLVKLHYFSNLYKYYINQAHLVAITGGFSN